MLAAVIIRTRARPWDARRRRGGLEEVECAHLFVAERLVRRSAPMMTKDEGEDRDPEDGEPGVGRVMTPRRSCQLVSTLHDVDALRGLNGRDCLGDALARNVRLERGDQDVGEGFFAFFFEATRGVSFSSAKATSFGMMRSRRRPEYSRRLRRPFQRAPTRP